MIKSADEHKKSGTYKPSRHANRVQEFEKPLETVPNPPADFDQRHSKKWEEVCKNLHNLRILFDQDLDVIEVYVRNWFIWVDASNEVSSAGITFVDENGRVSKNPAFVVMQDAGRVITQIGALIGYSPRARMGIKVTDTTKEKAATILDFIKGGQNKKSKTG